MANLEVIIGCVFEQLACPVPPNANITFTGPP
jgi:hypothetical protein